jgi:hypothetical protein
LTVPRTALPALDGAEACFQLLDLQCLLLHQA